MRSRASGEHNPVGQHFELRPFCKGPRGERDRECAAAQAASTIPKRRQAVRDVRPEGAASEGTGASGEHNPETPSGGKGCAPGGSGIRRDRRKRRAQSRQAQRAK